MPPSRDRDERPRQRAHAGPRAAAAGLAAQKKSLHATERDTPRVQQARAAYRALIQPLDLQRFRFLDESGITLAMTRRFGRAPRGERVVGTVPQNDGAHLTMIAALSRHGIDATMTREGATDTDVLQADVEHILGPTLRSGDIVVLDNWRAHKVARIREAIESRGAQLIDWPPYSPDLAPLEPWWSQIKTFLRTAQARTRQALEAAIQQALTTITAAEARSWFTSCG